MSDSEIQVDLGTGGVYVDTSQVSTSEGQPVQRQRVAIGDASTGENFLGIGADGASSVHVISTPTAGSVSVNNFPATQVVSGSVSVINETNAPASVSVLNFPSSTSVAGSVSVNNFPSSFIISNLPTVQPVSQASNWGASISNFPANQTVSGSVSVLDFPTNQVVSGSVGVNNFPAFPAVQTVSGSVSVLDFPATQNVAGSVSVLDFPANQVVSGSVSVVGSVNANVTDFPAVQAVSGSVSSIQTGTWYTTVSGSVTAIPYGVQTVSGSVSVLNPSSGGGSASVSILNSALLPVADAASEASLAIVGIPNIDKAISNANTLALNTAYTWNITSTLAASVAASGSVSVIVNAVVGPAGGSFAIKIDSEQMLVTAGNGTTTLTVTSGNRGYNGTVAASHANGATATTLIGFTANEIEITNTNGIAVVYYTLDGTVASATNFTGVLVATPCSTILPCNGVGPALGGGTSLQMIAAGTPLITAAIRGA